jgi:hypothetical protein
MRYSIIILAILGYIMVGCGNPSNDITDTTTTTISAPQPDVSDDESRPPQVPAI